MGFAMFYNNEISRHSVCDEGNAASTRRLSLQAEKHFVVGGKYFQPPCLLGSSSDAAHDQKNDRGAEGRGRHAGDNFPHKLIKNKNERRREENRINCECIKTQESQKRLKTIISATK
jgi:hypothetical protein